MDRILLIEDAVEFQKIVERALSSDFAVVMAATAAEARGQLERGTFDLILLDVMLPDEDGFKFCAALQNNDRTKEIPVIFLTGKGEVSDRVMGFALGADDYITKPFSPAELRARVEARLRKMRSLKEREDVYRRGDLRFNVSFQKAIVTNGSEEAELDLTPREFKLLLYLARHEEQVVSRDQLITAIWGGHIHVIDRTVDVHVSNLRKKLVASAYTIKAVRGVGFTFKQK